MDREKFKTNEIIENNAELSNIDKINDQIETNKTNEDEIDEGKKKRGRFTKWILLILVILLCLLLLFSCQKKTEDVGIIPGSIDLNVSDISEDKNEMQERVNEKVSDGMVNISMNTYICADSKTKDSNIYIRNKNDDYQQFVEIQDKEGNIIYKSGLIPPGKSVKGGKLQNLPKNSKEECLAILYNVDKDGSTVLGKVGVKVVIDSK